MISWVTKYELSFMAVEVDNLDYWFTSSKQRTAEAESRKPPLKLAASRLDRIDSMQRGNHEDIDELEDIDCIPTTPFRYNPLHDLESIWWVAICFVFNNSVVKVGGKPPSMDASQRGSYDSQEDFAELLTTSPRDRLTALAHETALAKKITHLHAAVRKIANALIKIKEELVNCYLEAEKQLDLIHHTVGQDLLDNVFITWFGKVLRYLQKEDIEIDILDKDPRLEFEDPFETVQGQHSVTNDNASNDDADIEHNSDESDQGPVAEDPARVASIGTTAAQATAKDDAQNVIVEGPDAGRSVDKATGPSAPQISTEPLVEGRSTRPQRKRAPPVRYGSESNVNALPMCPNSSWAAERQAYGTARSMPVVGSVVMDPRDLRRPKMVDMGSWHTETLSVSLSEWRGAKLETSGWRCEEAGQSSETGTLLVSLMVTVRIRSLSYPFTLPPMFQTLSSFLPSTIQQFGSDKPAPTPEVAPALPRQPPPSDMRPVEEQPVLYHWTLLADETAGSSGHPSYTSAMARKHCYYANFADQLRARSGSRKIFGKLFKRKEGDVGTPPPSPLPLNQSVMPSMPSMESTRSKRTSLLSAHGHVLSASVSEPPLQPPVLGIQPSLRSPTVPPKGRPTKYVWIVRKWLKGEPESMFRDVKDRLQEARNGNAAAGLEGIVEVRFEWSRGRSTQKRGRDGEHVRRESTRRRNRASLVGSSATPSTASLHHPSTQSPVRQPQSQSQRTLSPGNAPRRSVDSARSISPGPASIVTGESTDESGRAARREREEDDGDESDPEDSETPWTCTLVVRRLHAPPPARSPQHLGAGASPQPQPPQSIRVKVAAVVPTPHHPKVVALLKVSFPLPDVEIERVAVHRRVVTPQGIARPAVSPLPPAAPSGGSGKSSKFWGGGGGGKESGRVEAGRPASVMLTAEEIKDVVSCTALWLVVREGFGGVGRERRKGDRWMLRG
ncbi:hypothetical protein IEO21_09131 [Rhodonia placenta]|uniref:Uncharacterized protein n=1 Tax=Rhodonia placenta TaxID=104341 RepID=A0A8H7TYR0_9APHY|nr:hypothetical protein IEO21_09131 [Postia placenta]